MKRFCYRHDENGVMLAKAFQKYVIAAMDPDRGSPTWEVAEPCEGEVACMILTPRKGE